MMGLSKKIYIIFYVLFSLILSNSSAISEEPFPNFLSDTEWKEMLDNVQISTKNLQRFLDRFKEIGNKLDYNSGKTFDTISNSLNNLCKTMMEDIDNFKKHRIESKINKNLPASFDFWKNLELIDNGMDIIHSTITRNLRGIGASKGESICDEILDIKKDYLKFNARFKNHFKDLLKAKEMLIEVLEKDLENCKKRCN